MARAFCPKCGNFTFAYDPEAEVYRCYSTKCEFIDKDEVYGRGLPDNPFIKRDASTGLETLMSPDKANRF